MALVAPTVVAPGEPFALNVAVLDEHGYPSVEFSGKVRIRGEFTHSPLIEMPFRKGRPALARAEGLVVPSVGLFRFEGTLGGEAWHSNPVCCRRGPGLRVAWGDPHVHTILSACHAEGARSLNFCYAAARYMSGLDWVSAADHVSNGRCDFSKWREQMAACQAHDDPPDFVTLPSYEASLKGGAGGDTNPYFRRPPEMFIDEYEAGNARTLCEKLGERVGRENFFVVPHHTTRTGKHGEIPDEVYPGEALMPVIEIHSKWGTSEHRGNANPLHQVHPGPSYAVDLLNRGLKLGFIAGTDSHATMPSATGIEPGHIDRLPGLTAALVPELSRDAVFDALRSRRCYAASRERVYLDVSVGGTPMGQTAAWPDRAKPRTIQVAAAAQSDIVAVEVVRNGETIHRHPAGAWQAALLFDDEVSLDGLWLESEHLGCFAYTYVRVTCASGARAWSSPVWLLKAP
ncbi:MAG TPA: hypothetical protein VNE39_13155 [Planctomycetota bacterium]|nr:hypothetical protein [Planctomycetota bacterium]